MTARFPATVLRLVGALLLGGLLALALVGRGEAQTALDQQTPILADYARQLSELERQAAAHADDDGRLVTIRGEIEGLLQAVLASRRALAPRVQEIGARLEQIGPAPGPGMPPEPAALTAERAALLKERAEINATTGEADRLAQSVARVDRDVARMRSDVFAATLWRRNSVPAAFADDIATHLGNDVTELGRRFGSWLSELGGARLPTALAGLAVVVAFGLGLLAGCRRLLARLIHPNYALAEPSMLNRLSVAFWSTAIPSAAVSLWLAATYFLTRNLGLLRPDIEDILVTVFNVIATVYFTTRLCWTGLAPSRPNWRIFPMTDAGALSFCRIYSAASVIAGVDFVLNRINLVLESPLSLVVARGFVAAALIGVLVIMLARLKPFLRADGAPKGWDAWFRWLMIGLGLLTILAAALGYVGFARFVARQPVITGALLATMYIGFLSARGMSEFGGLRQTLFGRRLADRFGMSEVAQDQAGLGMALVIHLVLLLIGIPLILLQFGFLWGDVFAWVSSLVREVRIGSVSFSLVGLLTGIAVFVVGYFATRWFQSWLDGSVMTRGRLDLGLRNSIKIIVGYLGLGAAVLIGLAAAGIDLSNFALIAGGLSLGIGFGLQNIVSNFVSGLILLAERPFKAGDWIETGAISGTVRKISVRATEIETFQRQTVVLPNSDLINAAVGNWTRHNNLGRIDIRVAAAYGVQPRKVHGLLLELAGAHPHVLKTPAPTVLFANIADTGLEFELRVFLADIHDSVSVQNDLRFAIMERFEAEGIAIPYSPRALHPPEEEAPARPNGAPADPDPAPRNAAPPLSSGKRARRPKPSIKTPKL